MNLVNTDGLVLFGPSSEWFWSMAQLVVAVTLVGIYSQLRIARSAKRIRATGGDGEGLALGTSHPEPSRIPRSAR